MTGEFVIVRAYNGPLIRRVLEVRPGVVYIASEEQYELWERGQPALEPVGFRLQDVFQYEPKMGKELACGKVDWKRLTPYKGKS